MLTEEELIRVYRRTIRELYGFVCSRTGGDRQLAEDFVQETYMRALAEWRTKGTPQNAAAWLKTVARNLLVSHYRKVRPSSLTEADMGSVDLRLELEKRENSALVYWGLSRLSRRRAELLESFHFDGRSVKQIAREKGISERAVEGRLRRARMALKETIVEVLKGGKYEHG